MQSKDKHCWHQGGSAKDVMENVLGLFFKVKHGQMNAINHEKRTNRIYPESADITSWNRKISSRVT